MATPAQIAANRRNAQWSTGPKTEAGKQASNRNAIKHGILAQVVPQDTPGFQDLLLGLYESLRPSDETQRFLVEQIALGMLRLQRSAAYEQRWLGTAQPVPLPACPPHGGAAEEEPPHVSEGARVGEFMHSRFCPVFLRYEAACNSQIRRNLDLLLKLQATARATHKPACPYLTDPEPADAERPNGTADHAVIRRAGATPPAEPGNGSGNLPPTEHPITLTPSSLEGEGRDAGRPTGLHTVGENELASFRRNNTYACQPTHHDPMKAGT
jgi:hypothetical protein